MFDSDLLHAASHQNGSRHAAYFFKLQISQDGQTCLWAAILDFDIATHFVKGTVFTPDAATHEYGNQHLIYFSSDARNMYGRTDCGYFQFRSLLRDM